MLPVSAWPPGPPGASLSPFGKPRSINVSCDPQGYVIPPGAWVVATTSNRVVMFRPPVLNQNPARSPGTGLLPGTPAPPPPTSCGCPPPQPIQFMRYNDYVEAWRAWQRTTGNTDPPIRPLPGRRPPNWFGWQYVPAPSSTLVGSNSSGLVIADGQNVVITGGGCATLTQAFSV